MGDVCAWGECGEGTARSLPGDRSVTPPREVPAASRDALPARPLPVRLSPSGDAPRQPPPAPASTAGRRAVRGGGSRLPVPDLARGVSSSHGDSSLRRWRRGGPAPCPGRNGRWAPWGEAARLSLRGSLGSVPPAVCRYSSPVPRSSWKGAFS